jgi:hypothetical protein
MPTSVSRSRKARLLHDHEYRPTLHRAQYRSGIVSIDRRAADQKVRPHLDQPAEPSLPSTPIFLCG